MTQKLASNQSYAAGSTSNDNRAIRRSVVVGGSSGVGRALVQVLAARGDRVFTVARDRADLEALQRDCALRFGAEVNVEAADIGSADFDPSAFVARCIHVLGHVTHVFLPIGAVSTDDRPVAGSDLIAHLATVNYIRPAQLLGVFSKHFENNGYGHATIFSSIAAAAPRGNNAAYAAAKAALEFYCRALQHHFSDSPVSLHICALGYVDTSMSFGLKLQFPIASVEDVAKYAVRMSETSTRMAYFPRFWSIVVTALKILPWPIYKRLRF